MSLPSLPARPDLPDLPIDRRDRGVPGLTPAPSLAELRSSLPILPAHPSPSLGAPTAAPDLVPDIDLERRNLPIILPDPLNRPTAPLSVTPIKPPGVKPPASMAQAALEPLRDWTEADVWAASRLLGIPQNEARYRDRDPGADNDYHELCTRCFLGGPAAKSVICPKTGEETPVAFEEAQLEERRGEYRRVFVNIA